MLVVIGDGDPIIRPDRQQIVYRWRFKCDCGNETDARPGDVKRSIQRFGTASCGCYRVSLNANRGVTHGKHATKTWRAWKAMKSRCTDTGRPQWKDYGGRGITFCDRWKSFEPFLEDMGECPPGMTLDRIDNNGNYEPGNCRWTTPQIQHRNRRSNAWVVLDGERMIFTDACKAIGRKASTLSVAMLRRGLTHQEVIDLYRRHQ